MDRRRAGQRVASWRAVVAMTALGLGSGCDDSPTAPSSTASLPLVRETSDMRYYHEPGDTIEFDRQEAFNAWALQRLGVRPPRPVEYRKYLNRAAMGRYTGNSNTNGFAEPEQWRFHTIWPFDNHEVVHVYSAMIGTPSDFFNEGVAVSLQTDPANNDFVVRFNGQQVHDACRGYLATGTLPQPLSRYATTAGFRGITDSVLSYRMAGSFVLFLTDRFGMAAVQAFVRASTRDDSLATIRARMEAAFGASLEQAEVEWLTALRQP
jgi:hypothetical protein